MDGEEASEVKAIITKEKKQTKQKKEKKTKKDKEMLPFKQMNDARIKRESRSIREKSEVMERMSWKEEQKIHLFDLPTEVSHQLCTYFR